MDSTQITTNGNVILIDPNNININNNIINSVPEYQNMYIWTELTAIRRGRSVLSINERGIVSQVKTGLEENISINFLGNNQDEKNAQFTTNWYDDGTGENKQYESFGITNIKVMINSSFIPQVNIKFVDIRGLSFFNQKNSPYRIIFDFPPPIFELTIKGYFGKAIKYRLHLVKYTTEFNSTNGNFYIDADFVAITYAPLTDILFRYIINFPLISNTTPFSPNTAKEPRNTNELLLKIKNLYSRKNNFKDTSIENETYNTILRSIENLQNKIDVVRYADRSDKLTPAGVPYLMIRDLDGGDGDELISINGNIGKYNNILKDGSSDIPTQQRKRLYLGYVINEKFNSKDFSEDEKLLDKYVTVLYNFVTQNLRTGIGNNLLKNPQPIVIKYNLRLNKQTSDNVLYCVTDLTEYYMLLYNQLSDLEIKKINILFQIDEKINDIIIDSLGMKPTIYNIFKIILNDVDTFFKILINTSLNAEKEHRPKYYDEIVNDLTYKDIKDIEKSEKRYYSFPLTIKIENECGKQRQTRVAPIEISNRLPEKFPELDLIEKFIETFRYQDKIRDAFLLKDEQNDDGNKKWIPISPVDTQLVNGNIQNPFYGIDISQINTTSFDLLSDVFNLILSRYYVLTQNVYPYLLYGQSPMEKTSRMGLINLNAWGEAVNLVISVINPTKRALLKDASKIYIGDIEEFYRQLERNDKKNKTQIYGFNTSDEILFGIKGFGNLYTTKENDEYQGVFIYRSPIKTQNKLTRKETKNLDPKNAVESFMYENRAKYFEVLGLSLFDTSINETLSKYEFTSENIFYLADGNSDKTINGTPSESRFISNPKNIELKDKGEKIQYYTVENIISTKQNVPVLKTEEINLISNGGNKLIGYRGWYDGARKYKINVNFIDTWVDMLTYGDTRLYDTIINNNSLNFNRKLSSLLILSNFGNTVSPFNIYPNYLNEFLFKYPAIINAPKFLLAYMGLLIDVAKDDDFYTEIYNFFVSGAGKYIKNSGIFIFADIYDLNKHLSKKDKEIFKQEYDSFMNTNFDGIISSLNELYVSIRNNEKYKEKQKILIDSFENSTTIDYIERVVLGLIFGVELSQKQIILFNELSEIKLNLYKDGLNGVFFETIAEPLLKRQNIINFSQLTFSFDKSPNPNGYVSLINTNQDVLKKEINNSYFKKFFEKINSEFEKLNKNEIEIENQNKRLTGDEDIITQTYYSFKNINDKWVSGLNNLSGNNVFGGYNSEYDVGYPFNISGKRLIDSFAFVDRAMNPIGNTIINPEILLDMFEDTNISVFTVISQLLSLNGFEFFPLQNFMSFDNKGWFESFKIDTSGVAVNNPVFVCMYIGGASSYPTEIEERNTGFVDDSIVDIVANDIPDFTNISDSNENCVSIDDDAQTERNDNFPYSQVRAFRVRFAEQNQTMFTDIKIDSKEYSDTNESIQILSRLAGDNKQEAPVPKGQNLYNLYENRSYKASVTGLGNANIQPTQYFQIENVPLFNGAYVILEVEHIIEPNKMTTLFSGTKLLKYPIPRVLNPATIFGYDGGTSSKTSSSKTSGNDSIVSGVGTASNPEQSKYNSMYTLKIQ